MASDIWLRTILIVRKETCCRHIGYSYRLTARVLLYAPSHRQDNTYHGLCYTSRRALAGTRNSSTFRPRQETCRAGGILLPTLPPGTETTTRIFFKCCLFLFVFFVVVFVCLFIFLLFINYFFLNLLDWGVFLGFLIFN